MSMTGGIGAYKAYNAQMEATKKAASNEATGEAEGASKANESKNQYGKTIGDPKLSKEAKKYYDQLKKKYGNYDFILVSKDEMENAKANAAKYANKFRTVVLIDEEKIERMATDENFRKKYEGILSGAATQLEQMKASMEKSGANVKGFGMQVNDDGTTSFFAVLKKSSAEQKARIEKKAEQKRAEKKAAEKQADKERKEARLHKGDKEDWRSKTEDSEETETISANSLEELIKKIEEFNFANLSDTVQTESEKMLGQNIDFKG